MADNKTKQKTAANEEQQNNEPIADLNVSTIIVALHQNAVAKCQGDLADKYRIVNSAIDESTGTATLASSGEQIVSVIPTEAAASSKAFDKLGTMPKEDAVKILKTYVQWFVGPDLAKKVGNKTVIALTDAPKDMKDVKAREDAKKKEETGRKEAQQNVEKDLVDTESVIPVIKFSQFLREANEKTEASGEKPEETKPKDAKAKLQQVDPMEVDATTKQQAGYYIVYEMKVEGLKEVKLEDSKKSMRKSIMNYLGNFFDDVKITASGLFGGGDSFTVKDVKDKLRQTFGPIDPDELVRNVQERLDKKFKGSSPRAEVEVQDKRTLIADLGSYIDGTQKRQIEKADYSLTISIDQDDPKKDILNRGLVADIVQASIKGLWKKFRNRISKNDVIYIPNYQNIHKDTEKIRALYQKVPSPNRIKAQIQKASDVNLAVNNIDKMFQIIGGDKYKDDCARAEKCDAAWKSFREKNKTGDRANELAKIHRGSKEFDDYFKKFLEQYTKVYNDTEMADLSESFSKACFMVSNADISKMLVESMFGSSSLWEEDSKDDSGDNAAENSSNSSKKENETEKFDAGKAKKHAKHYLKDVVSDIKIACGSIDDVNKRLEFFNGEVKNDEFKNAIAVLPSSSDSMPELSESQISDDIFSLLFEEDPVDKDTKDTDDAGADSGKATQSSTNANADSNSLDEKIHKILVESLKAANAKDIGNFIVLKPKTLSEAKTKAPASAEFKAKQSEALSTAVTEYVKNKSAGDALSNNKFYIGISSSDAVVNFLKGHGLGTDSEYERLLKKKHAFMFLTYPKPDKPLVKKNAKKDKKNEKGTKDTKSAAGTPGYGLFNANEVKSIVNNSRTCANDVDVFTITGKPSKAEVDSQVFYNNNKKIVYTGTDVIPECKIYLASVDLKEDGTSNDSTKPTDIPSIKNAYALTFGKEEIIEVKPEDIDIKAGDMHERRRNDLYIVPMPGLKYEDPEYANKKLM